MEAKSPPELQAELERIRAEIEGLRIALTWLAPFISMTREDLAAALQGAGEEARFEAEAGALPWPLLGTCTHLAQTVLQQAGAFCGGGK